MLMNKWIYYNTKTQKFYDAHSETKNLSKARTFSSFEILINTQYKRMSYNDALKLVRKQKLMNLKRCK